MTTSTTQAQLSKQQAPYDNAVSFYPSDSLVISRHSDGSVASYYGDLRWDWTPYGSTSRLQYLNFRYWKDNLGLTNQRKDLVGEIRWLLHTLISHSNIGQFSFKGISNHLSLLRRMAKHCEKSKIIIKDLLTDSSALWTFVHESSGAIASKLLSFCSKLIQIGSDITRYPVPRLNFIRSIRKVAVSYKKSLNQHPPMPTRIYSHVLTVLSEELSDFQSIALKYLDLVKKCVENPFLGRSTTEQKRIRAATGKTIERDKGSMLTLLDEHGLSRYFEKTGLDATVLGLFSGLQRIMIVVRLTIQAYTGMRDGEVSHLNYKCIERRVKHGRTCYVIHGATTKLNGGRPKKARWVTNEEGARAVAVAQKITALNHHLMVQGRDGCKQTLNEVPLLASIKYFRLGARYPTRYSAQTMLAGGAQIWRGGQLRTRLEPAMAEEDLCELEQIDPHRAWRSEPKFLVGTQWTFTSHQLRRSLALYAQRSGLVSLPSLRRQLQHITEAMSRYYARGSAFARNFIGSHKDHFAREWRATTPFSSALSYIKHVLFSDEIVFGGHGSYIENRFRVQGDVVEVSREATHKRFASGEMAYRETNLGGCTKIGPCDKRPINWLNIDCIKGCRHFVGRMSSLDRVISAQQTLVGSLDPSSVGYQSENADLQLLTEVRDRVRAQSTKKKTK
ncbi:hypothetical protein [Paraburkholderia caribensis]|uniref:hypothetical protein n=1 Tax=Paraburkholderia caribensis TaxID=75105 RepID=UPI002858AE19|nr:hypothetical protein [Paraburkholderia caribensis]MDR6382148.1 integrase [Paraburkholderia caribensis]